MKQINEIKRMQQLAGILVENEAPKAITVELTDNFKKTKNLYHNNSSIKMRPDRYYNLGNTKAGAYEEVNVYFGKYRPDIQEIQVFYYVIPGQQKGEIEWFLYLMKQNQLYPTEIQNINKFVEKGELKMVPDFDSNFRDSGGLNVGSKDHRDYFKIIDIEN